MLYLYKNQLEVYEVIDHVDLKETLLFESNNKEQAVLFFENEIKRRRKTTIKSFDGREIKTNCE